MSDSIYLITDGAGCGCGGCAGRPATDGAGCGYDGHPATCAPSSTCGRCAWHCAWHCATCACRPACCDECDDGRPWWASPQILPSQKNLLMMVLTCLYYSIRLFLRKMESPFRPRRHNRQITPSKMRHVLRLVLMRFVFFQHDILTFRTRHILSSQHMNPLK